MMLEIWAVFQHPRDYPDQFAARLFTEHGPTETLVLGPTLHAVRLQLPPGLYRLARMPNDDPVIVETWL